MSIETLYRYGRAVTTARLADVLEDPCSVDMVPLGLGADFTQLVQTMAELQTGQSRKRADWDRELAQPLHQALRSLSRRDASDMRFWHWLCVARFPEYVWGRWNGEEPKPDAVRELLQQHPALAGRFVGAASLHGVSRNALARLWWCAETLSEGGRDYNLVREALTYQDFFQAIFERELGLYPPTARVLLRLYRDSSEAKRRQALVKLNHYFTTIVAESLEEEDIQRLLVG